MRGTNRDQIIRLLEKKSLTHKIPTQKRIYTAVYQYLMRRGFRSNDVLRAMKK